MTVNKKRFLEALDQYDINLTVFGNVCKLPALRIGYGDLPLFS